MTVKKQSTIFDWRWLLAIPLLIAALAILIYAWTFSHLPHNQDPGAWGTFGDYFGGLLNPVVSTLTLFVAVAVWQLQREAIALQRSELEETRIILAEQALTARQDRNEQRFFDLLNTYHRTLDSTQFHSHTGHKAINSFCIGHPTFSAFLERGLHTFQIYNGNKIYEHFFDNTPKTEVTVAYLEDFWSRDKDRGLFNPYLRMIERLLSDAKDLLGNEECYRYIKLFRAQLSDIELQLISLEVLLNNEAKILRMCIEEFGLLQYLPNGPFRGVLEKELPPEVFGQNFVAQVGSSDNSLSKPEVLCAH